jgi:hypothetical protein
VLPAGPQGGRWRQVRGDSPLFSSTPRESSHLCMPYYSVVSDHAIDLPCSGRADLSLLERSDAKGRTPIMHAVKGGHIQVHQLKPSDRGDTVGSYRAQGTHIKGKGRPDAPVSLSLCRIQVVRWLLEQRCDRVFDFDAAGTRSRSYACGSEVDSRQWSQVVIHLNLHVKALPPNHLRSMRTALRRMQA